MTLYTKKKLPIGIQTFREIREEDRYYYVDKTSLIQSLLDHGKHYFLSRPRRFGKSLLIDTLKELFEGNEALFRGLAIHDKWEWSITIPVISISFGRGVAHTHSAHANALQERMHELLLENQERLGIHCEYPSVSGRFSELIRKAYQKYGQRVVLLIDEYDKPILDNLMDPVIAATMREELKNFYSVIKEADAYLRFTFLTGVSKFSKVSLFSGLNNLKDITLDKRYSTLCGYTDNDINTLFSPELHDLDREDIRRWYNGYGWLGERVYNPFDILLLFDRREFYPYWFETGTPTFLIDILTMRGFSTPRLACLQTDADLLGQFDVDNISTEALLFQTGYLTIRDVAQPSIGQWIYTLGYPNREVESSLNKALLPALGLNAQRALENRLQLLDALQNNNFSAMQTYLHALYASLAHDWYRNNPIAHYEGYYASVFYSHFAAWGLDIIVEDVTNHGNVDITIDFNDSIYLFEFKVVDSAANGKAMTQLLAKNYAEKYRSSQKNIYLIGIEFSKEQRNIIAFDVVHA